MNWDEFSWGATWTRSTLPCSMAVVKSLQAVLRGVSSDCTRFQIATNIRIRSTQSSSVL